MTQCSKRTSQEGFTHTLFVALLVLGVLVVGAGYYVWKVNSNNTAKAAGYTDAGPGPLHIYICKNDYGTKMGLRSYAKNDYKEKATYVIYDKRTGGTLFRGDLNPGGSTALKEITFDKSGKAAGGKTVFNNEQISLRTVVGSAEILSYPTYYLYPKFSFQTRNAIAKC